MKNEDVLFCAVDLALSEAATIWDDENEESLTKSMAYINGVLILAKKLCLCLRDEQTSSVE